MPQLEELAHASEETLVDVLGFPEQEARHFAMLNEESKQRLGRSRAVDSRRHTDILYLGYLCKSQF